MKRTYSIDLCKSHIFQIFETYIDYNDKYIEYSCPSCTLSKYEYF